MASISPWCWSRARAPYRVPGPRMTPANRWMSLVMAYPCLGPSARLDITSNDGSENRPWSPGSTDAMHPSPWGRQPQFPGTAAHGQAPPGPGRGRTGGESCYLAAIDVSMRGRTMRIRKRLAQLGLIMVALPLVGWGLDQLAKRAEERRPGSGK